MSKFSSSGTSILVSLPMPSKVSVSVCAMKGLQQEAFVVFSRAFRPWSAMRPHVKCVLPIPRSWAVATWNALTGGSISTEFRLRPVVVMQDIDDPPGTGAFFDKVHANIFGALGCVGAITNGAARELPGTEASAFQVFAGRIAISRAYIHIVEFGKPVEVGGLTIQPGDLIHGDRHGIVTIPQELEFKLPAVARVIREKKQQLIDLSRKPGTTHEELSRGLRDLLDFNPDSDGD